MQHLYKRLIVIGGIVLSLSGICLGQSFPTTKGYVSDYVGIIRPQYTTYLSNISRRIDAASKTQIMTVVIESLDGITIEEYANRLYEEWGVGDKDTHQGALLLLAMKEKKVRIEVGYGLEAILPDGKSGYILDQYIVPHFKNGNYEKGIASGHLAIANIVGKAFQIPLNNVSQYEKHAKSQETPLNTASSVILLGGIVMMMCTRRGRQMMPLFLFLMMGSGRRCRGSSFGSFGGSGFGGFGGGLSGGGGASRGW